MKLVAEKTGKPLKVGAKLRTFRGEPAILRFWQEPQHEASTGRVFVTLPGYTTPQGFFPGVVGAKFVKE